LADDRARPSEPIEQSSAARQSAVTDRPTPTPAQRSAVLDRASAISAPHRPKSVESNPTASQIVGDGKELFDEIEAAAKRTAPSDAASPAVGRISSRKLKSLLHVLETANVLDDDATIERRQALLELGQSQDPQVLAVLLEHTQDSSSAIRDGAVTALGDFGDPTGVPHVLRALLDRNLDVVRAAFTALKKIGDSRVVRPLLRYGLERPQWKPLSNDTLVRIGSRVVPDLLKVVQGNDSGLCLDAILVLGRIGDKQAIPLLLPCLDHFPDVLKAPLIEALALIGDPRVVPHLLRALDDPNSAIRANAAAGLVRLIDPRSLGPLIKALQDEDSNVRCYAATALGELKEPKAASAMAKILPAWESLVPLDAPFMEAVVEALGKLGDASIVPDLLPLLESQHDGVLLKTIVALKKLRAPSASQALIRLLHVPKPTVRRRVLETLGLTGDASLVPTIGSVLQDDHVPEVRAAAARALGELKSKEALTFLEDALNQEFAIRCQAVIALGAIHDRRSLPALMAMLKDAAPEVRYHAINAIAKFKDAKTLRALAVLLEDPDPMVRNAAAKVVEEFGPGIEDKAVKQIIQRARARDLLGKLIPNWVLLFVPSRKVALSALAALLLIGLLGTVGYTLWVGPPTQVLARGKVAKLAMSPDGSTLVAERTLGMLEVWDVDRERVLQRASTKANGKSPRFRAKDGLILVLGDSLIPWNLPARPDPSTGWKEHRQPIVALYTTPGGEFAATMDHEANVVVWDLEAGRKAGQLKLDLNFKQSLTVSPKGRLLATSNTTGDVVVWDVKSGERIREIPHAQGAKPCVIFSFNAAENGLVGADQSGGLNLIDLEADTHSSKIVTHELERPIAPIDVRFLPDGKSVLVADVGGDIFMWNLESDESVVVCKSGISPLEGLAMNADGTHFAAGNSESTEVVVFSLETGKPIKRLDAN
jgi:HEAT repeat protein